MAQGWTLNSVSPILPVRDVRASLALYETLGFKPRIYGDAGNEDLLIYGFLHRGSVHLHLALHSTLDPDANTTAVYFYVDDPDALYREWRAVNPDGRLQPPEDREWGMREMSYADPDGNLLRIGRPLTQ